MAPAVGSGTAADVTAPQGGSMAQLMADGATIVDAWVKYATDNHATTPEMVAMMLIQNDQVPNRGAVFAIVAATAIQRLVTESFDDGATK